jgi:hypothetical protein
MRPALVRGNPHRHRQARASGRQLHRPPRRLGIKKLPDFDVARIRKKGASIEIGGLGLINGDDPVSMLLMNVLGSIAQLEREIMLARQKGYL